MLPVDVILTSYRRWDLLDKTLESFFYYNTCQLGRFLVYDDFGLDNMTTEDHHAFETLKRKYRRVTWLAGAQRIGQVLALDTLMRYVATPLYFSLEDDWFFFRHSFIEAGVPMLKRYRNCIQVWLRQQNDTNGHPIVNHNGVLKMQLNFNGQWNGFSFNPALRRLEDYRRIGSYQRHTTFDPAIPWKSESAIGRLYADMGYFASITNRGYVWHTGDNRGVRS